MLTLIEKLEAALRELQTRVENDLKQAPPPHWAGINFEERSQRIRELGHQKVEIETMLRSLRSISGVESARLNRGMKRAIAEAHAHSSSTVPEGSHGDSYQGARIHDGEWKGRQS